jgi:hypothetical protein
MLRLTYHLDDLLILTNSSFKDHQLKLEMVLARLSTAGMRVNISKSKFFEEQIEYLALGYWITRQGIQPIHNKVEAILNINAPKTRNEEPATPVYWYSQLLLWHVVSQNWASSLVPLTSLTSSLNVTHQINKPLKKSRKSLELRYKYFSVCHPVFRKQVSFHLYIDASDHHLGAAIMQDKNQNNIVSYLQKLNTVQKRYSTIERELLSANETFKE